MTNNFVKKLVHARPHSLVILWVSMGILISIIYAGISTYLHYLEYQPLSESHPAAFSQGLYVMFFSMLFKALVDVLFVSATISAFAMVFASFKYQIKGGMLVSSGLSVTLLYFCFVQIFGPDSETLGDVISNTFGSFGTDMAMVVVALAVGIAAEFFAQKIHKPLTTK